MMKNVEKCQKSKSEMENNPNSKREAMNCSCPKTNKAFDVSRELLSKNLGKNENIFAFSTDVDEDILDVRVHSLDDILSKNHDKNCSVFNQKNESKTDDDSDEEFSVCMRKMQKNAQKQAKNAKINNKITILKEKSVSDWVEIVLAVYPYLPAMCEFVDGLMERVAEGSYHHSYKMGGIGLVCEDLIDLVERKTELVNLNVVAEKLLFLADKKETDVIETTLTKTRKIVEIAKNGFYNWVYRARAKYIKKANCFCMLNGWDEDFFMRHFAHEPLVQYYV